MTAMQPYHDPRREERHEGGSWPFLRSPKLWSIVAAVVLLLVFTVQNTTALEVHVLVWSFTASGAFLVLATAALAFSAGWVLRSARGPGFNLFG